MTDLNHISFNIPNEQAFYQIVIKKSRFIVHIKHTPNIKRAKSFIALIKEKYKDANHNCWAYIAGRPDDSQILGFSDDGEPNGTAGRPMLNVLMGSKFGEITAVVTRYFGGIKLGTGGLARAYGGSLNNALDDLSWVEKIPEGILGGKSAYGHQKIIEMTLEKHNIIDVKKIFKTDISWVIKMDIREVPLVISEILDKTSGRVIFTIVEEL